MSLATTTEVSPLKLSLTEKTMLLRGIRNPNYFKEAVRPMLYKKCGDDPERVHEFMLTIMHAEGKQLARILSPFFKFPKNLMVKVNGVDIVPLGSAAGSDKNGEALTINSVIYGFQEPGTVVLKLRLGNPPVRVAVIEEQLDMVNAQGFPSKGLEYFFTNLSAYRNNGGTGKIYVSICGLPLSEENAVQMAMEEMRILIRRLENLVDGFVWNPFSPNTAAITKLRTPEIFYETARLMKDLAPNKLRMVKLGPYEPEGKAEALQLVDGFISGGGHGVVTTNTKMIKKEQLPHPVRDKWGYPSAGRSGLFLRDYRLRSVKDLRISFPDAIIFATGGIYQHDAFETFGAGATAIQGFTPYVYYGPGLVREHNLDIQKGLRRTGVEDLQSFQDTIKENARRGKLR